MQVWQCAVCAYIYDEEVGIPEDGIPAGTPWGNVPQDWCCPECGVSKADFFLVDF